MTSKERKSEGQVRCFFVFIHIQETVWSRSALLLFRRCWWNEILFESSQTNLEEQFELTSFIIDVCAFFSLSPHDWQTIKISSAVIDRSSKKNSDPFDNHQNAFGKISLNVFEKRLRGRTSQMLKLKRNKSSGSMRTEREIDVHCD